MNLMVQTADMSTQNHTHIGNYGKNRNMEFETKKDKKTRQTDKQNNRQNNILKNIW